MKQELTQANVTRAIRAAGYDPDKADWPRYLEVTAPTFGAVTAVVQKLGHHYSNRDARVIVGSTMQTLMMGAKPAT